MQGIFLSYRREDSAPHASSLQLQLRQRLPDAQVFMDLDSIEPGLDFAEIIEQAVSSCAVLVALIGRQWATAADEQGDRRLDNPDDFVRFEVQAALQRGIRVIPVLVDGAKPLRRQDLPADLHKLARLNAHTLSYTRYKDDTDTLVDLIQRVLAAVSEREEAEQKAREEAEQKAREQAERQAREEAERQAQEQAEQKAREQAEQKAREQAERQAREQAEQLDIEYETAVRLLDAGNWREAIAALEQVAQVNPAYRDTPDLLERARRQLAEYIRRQRGERPHTWQVGQPVCALAFSPDGTSLVGGGREMVRVWSLHTAAVVLELPIGRRAKVAALAFSPDGTRLAGGAGRAARIWDATTGEQQLEVTHGRFDVLAVAFSPDGTRLATGSSYPYAKIWDTTAGRQQARVPSDAASPSPGVSAPRLLPPSVQDKMDVVAFSPDGTSLATGALGMVRVWSLHTAAVVLELPIWRRAKVAALAFSPDGTRLAGGAGRTARIWDATTGEQQLDVTHGRSDVLAVAFSPDGTRLATGGSSPYVQFADSYAGTESSARIWDTTTGEQQLEMVHSRRSEVLAVAFSPDGTRLATGANDNTARIWDITDG